ncbi:conserved hypothetical protein [Leishmania major strain Friedlin]|uniref:Gamma-butyrobetaine hydroxylase-like N-terminal domain-containing protein n=1 Tax=Leishmania major TaxID=5664 RepID=Q4QC54_LEIMA|nr:conserved hypothetical protein [Leishmania major strain Friedlin]CAG9573557.1 Protein_of_unknown_function_(DUF971)_-_putative [Leishmania major strain Friedlin]CAJ04799.1 conserved hypothetical protein [Leishmania major strain Friedlin]|eukprot:XP_001683094.1 conserved hypothetical protein [Leishmania major strain Friedlin]
MCRQAVAHPPSLPPPSSLVASAFSVQELTAQRRRSVHTTASGTDRGEGVPQLLLLMPPAVVAVVLSTPLQRSTRSLLSRRLFLFAAVAEMNRAPPGACALAAVAPLSYLRRRCTAASSSPPFLLSPLHAACASATARRPFTSSLLSKLGDSVASKVSRLAENVWLADEKLVTEPRRKFEPQRVANTSLAERLAVQRNVRQRLVPTKVQVDKSRQYVEFTWPADAVEVMRCVSLEAEPSDPTEPPRTSSAKSSSRPATAPVARPSSAGPAASSQAPERAATSARGAPAGELTRAPLPACHSPCVPSGTPLRTRALAEYLRAYTPSTDGALGGKDIIIYGRRGIAITKIIPVGNYALRFVFSDGHNGGIYSYAYLYYLTSPSTKYGLMRGYITELRQRRRSRDPPKRAPSSKYAKAIAQRAATTRKH